MYPIGPAVRRGWAACLTFGSCEGHLGPGEALAILAAGTAAGAVNAVVGSGSLITFPTLLAFGFPPVVANVSNNVGLVPGNVSSGFGYRRELAGQRRRRAGLRRAAGGGAPGGRRGAAARAGAALVFIGFAHVSWTAVALIAAGSTVGGLLGARFGRRLPPAALRLFVVVIGVVSAIKLLFF